MTSVCKYEFCASLQMPVWGKNFWKQKSSCVRVLLIWTVCFMKLNCMIFCPGGNHTVGSRGSKRKRELGHFLLVASPALGLPFLCIWEQFSGNTFSGTK